LAELVAGRFGGRKDTAALEQTDDGGRMASAGDNLQIRNGGMKSYG
jgi:hypothetical protein